MNCGVHGEKSPDGFYKNNGECITCKRQREKNRREREPKKIAGWKDRWRKNNKEYNFQHRKTYAQNNADVIKTYKALLLFRLKIEVLSHYCEGQPKCRLCEEEDVDCLCLDHTNQNGALHRRSITKNRSIYYWARKNKYPTFLRCLCHNCNVKEYRKFCGRSESKHSKYSQAIKKESFSIYCNGSIHCNKCSESDLDVLTIDHINGNGSIHRKTIRVRSGSGFYKWLKRNKYPDGFQVLCFNCNMKKAFEHKRNDKTKEFLKKKKVHQITLADLRA